MALEDSATPHRTVGSKKKGSLAYNLQGDTEPTHIFYGLSLVPGV